MLAFTKVALNKLFRTRSRGDEDAGEPHGEMGFLEHIEELRKVLFRCCLVFAIAAGFSLVYYRDIFRALRWPLEKAMVADAVKRGDAAQLRAEAAAVRQAEAAKRREAASALPADAAQAEVEAAALAETLARTERELAEREAAEALADAVSANTREAVAAGGAPKPPVADPEAGRRVLAAIGETGKIPAEALTGVIARPGALIHMQVMKIMDVFTILMDVAMFGGLAMAGPFILMFGAGFLAPALTASEKRFITPVILAAMALFCVGALLSFFWLCPISIEFALYLCRQMNLAWNWTAADYYSFVVMMTLLVGLVFEFPLVVVALQYFEVTGTRWLLSIWRQALLGILVIAVVFTPLGDPLSVSVLTGVLFALYLAAIFVGDWLMRMKRRRMQREADALEI